MRAFLFVAAAAHGASAAGSAQTPDPVRARYDSAALAWDAGRYPEALERFDRLLASPDAERVLKDVALLTGEYYRTVDVASDGRAIQWSPDGRYASYEVGQSADRRVFVVAVAAGNVRRVADVSGFGLAFAPAGDRATYLSVAETPELRALRDEVRRLVEASDFRAFQQRNPELLRQEALAARIVTRDLRTGREREVPAPGLGKRALAYGAGGELYLLAFSSDPARTDVYALGSGAPRQITDEPGLKILVAPPRAGALVYSVDRTRVAIRSLAGAAPVRTFTGTVPALSADGSTLVLLARDGADYTLNITSVTDSGAPRALLRSPRALANPALSPDGRRMVYQAMPREDWELYVVGSDGTGEIRLTREIQHDLLPRFATPDLVIAMMGEARHRRSYLYDTRTRERTRLFHNNTVRTVSQEYEWAVSPDGSGMLVVADRDGNTISPERGVYLVDLMHTVSVADVRARLQASLAAERDLRERGQRMFAPIADSVRAAVADISVARISGYAGDLYSFDSKFITQPGNRLAIDYLVRTLASWGYQAELQWFEPRPGVRTANVVATLRGTVHPELIYVIGSHFDSVEPGPGSDDNTTGTTQMLEAARVLANRPQAATIRFVWFTGEEAGLLGSAEFVRRAKAAGDRIVGVLNNDMLGWANDHRLDNTIRYSNDGIRDLQHAAAFLFTDLITYDSRYYRSTDAATFFENYGDIVGGIGSYPILGNPHYHQSHDVLETINQRLVAEVSKTSVASLMLLASSPARPTALTITATRGGGDSVLVEWAAAPERDVRSYVISYGRPGQPVRTATATEPRATLAGAPAGTVVSVKAVNARGLESWDWARVTVTAPPRATR